MVDTSLVFNLLAKDKTGSGIGSARRKFDMLAAGIVTAGVGIAVGLAHVGGQFDAATDTIRAGTGATGEALRALEQVNKDVMLNTGANIEQTSQTVADFNTMTGQSGEGLTTLATNFLNLQRITDGQAGSIEGLTRVFGDWGVETGKQAEAMDFLFKVSQSTGIGIDQLESSVVQFGAPLRNLGFSFEEAAALMGKWQQEGVNTSTVMGGLRIAIGNFAEAGRDPAVALQETITQMQGMSSESDRMSLAMEVFGARAGPDMAAAIMEGRFSIEDLMATLEGNTDTIAGVAAETEDWQEKLNKLKNKGLIALEPVASAVFDALGKGADVLASVAGWAQRNTGLAKGLAIALGVIAAVIVAVNIGMKIWSGIMMVKAGILAVVTAAQWAWNIAMMANPIGLIIIAIVLLIAGLVLLWQNSETFRNIVMGVWAAIWGAIKFVWDWIVTTLWPGIQMVWDGILMGAQVLWQGIKMYFGFWKGVLDAVIGWVVNVWTTAKSNFNKIVDFVSGLPGRIRSAASGMWDGITSAFRSAINAVISGWNNLSFTLPSVSVFGQTIGGFTLNTPNLPMLAAGAIVPATPGGTLAVLAEGGQDEVVAPLSSLMGMIRAAIREAVGARGAGINVEHMEVKAFSDNFNLKQVEDELALRGVS